MPRSELLGVFASIRRILQPWHTECTASTSRVSSTDQPLVSSAGSVEPPVWLTTDRQPLALVQVARLYWVSNVPRSASMFGSLYASTIATVWPLPPVVFSLYAR